MKLIKILALDAKHKIVLPMSKFQTIIHGPGPFDAARHEIYLLSCGNDYMDSMIAWRAGKNFGPDYAELIFSAQRGTSAIHQGTLLKDHVIAYVSGSIVRDSTPRIELDLIGVDQNFHGMGLAGAAAGQLLDTLYTRANMPDIEVRAIDVVGGHAIHMWKTRGFKHIRGTAHMTRTLTPDTIACVRGWKPHLRPDMQLEVPLRMKCEPV